jgi:hypothetical protein
MKKSIVLLLSLTTCAVFWSLSIPPALAEEMQSARAESTQPGSTEGGGSLRDSDEPTKPITARLNDGPDRLSRPQAERDVMYTVEARLVTLPPDVAREVLAKHLDVDQLRALAPEDKGWQLPWVALPDGQRDALLEEILKEKLGQTLTAPRVLLFSRQDAWIDAPRGYGGTVGSGSVRLRFHVGGPGDEVDFEASIFVRGSEREEYIEKGGKKIPLPSFNTAFAALKSRIRTGQTILALSPALVTDSVRTSHRDWLGRTATSERKIEKRLIVLKRF